MIDEDVDDDDDDEDTMTVVGFTDVVVDVVHGVVVEDTFDDVETAGVDVI